MIGFVVNGVIVKNQNDEELGNIVGSLLSRRKQTTDRANCPDEESLATYLSGGITEVARNKLEAHLAGCSLCLSEVAAASEAGEGSAPATVPRWLVERAMALVEAPKGEILFDLVVRFVKESVELVRASGEWMPTLTPVPVAVRGKTSTVSGILRVEREIAEHRVAVEVERVETGRCQVIVSVLSKDGKAQEGIRLSLLSGDREQASYLTRQGQAIFEGVAEGEYDLIISQAATTLGTIKLKIEGEK